MKYIGKRTFLVELLIQQFFFMEQNKQNKNQNKNLVLAFDFYCGILRKENDSASIIVSSLSSYT